MNGKDNVTAILTEFLSQIPDADPSKAFTRLKSAISESDPILAQTVREMAPLISLALLALSWELRQRNAITPRPRRKKGRPESGMSIGEWRAFRLWETANFNGLPVLSNRELINITRRWERDCFPDDKSQWLFPLSDYGKTIEQSVSRGRKSLGISEYWKSPRCEKLRQFAQKSQPIYSQTTGQAT